jgi:hypothetical protein
MAGNKAVNIGIDSKAFMIKAAQIKDMVIKGKHPRRPWGTQKDGDVWEHFYASLSSKGPLSFTFSKVKGHANIAMIQAGNVRAQDKEGNEMADRAAEEGVKMFVKIVNTIAGIIMKRHLQYSNMIKSLHDQFLAWFHTRKRMAEEQEMMNAQKEFGAIKKDKHTESDPHRLQNPILPQDRKPTPKPNHKCNH